MMCTISIIVPVYNSEKYLGKCLFSLQNQSFRDFEVIMIDDGSADGSLAICQDYTMKDSRFHSISTGNKGVSTARNIGLNLAVGQYICFVDSDDELKKDALSIMLNGMTPDVDLVIAGYEIFAENGQLNYSVTERIQRSLSKEEGVELMYRPLQYKYLGYCWGKLFRRTVIKKSNLRFDSDIYYNEDRLFTTKYICSQKKRVFFNSTPVYDYYERLSSVMAVLRSSFDRKFLTDFEAFRRMRLFVRKSFHLKKLDKMAQEGLVNSYHRIISLMKDNDEYILSLRLIILIKLLLSLSPTFYIERISNRILSDNG